MGFFETMELTIVRESDPETVVWQGAWNATGRDAAGGRG
jgi:hypothetical protein